MNTIILSGRKLVGARREGAIYFILFLLFFVLFFWKFIQLQGVSGVFDKNRSTIVA